MGCQSSEHTATRTATHTPCLNSRQKENVLRAIFLLMTLQGCAFEYRTILDECSQKYAGDVPMILQCQCERSTDYARQCF